MTLFLRIVIVYDQVVNDLSDTHHVAILHSVCVITVCILLSLRRCPHSSYTKHTCMPFTQLALAIKGCSRTNLHTLKRGPNSQHLQWHLDDEGNNFLS